jgi:hypothetical protein
MTRSHKPARIAGLTVAAVAVAALALPSCGAQPPAPTVHESPAAAAATTTTLRPVADAYVFEAEPTANFGAETRLRADGDAGRRLTSLLRFDVSGVAGTVEDARLRLYVVDDGTVSGPSVGAVGQGWEESSVTWESRPRTAAAVAEMGPAPVGSWVELEVTALARRGDTVDLALEPRGTDGAHFYAREGSRPPELVVTSRHFPQGTMADAGGDMAAVASLGFDFATLSAYRGYLDEAWAHGVQVLVWLGGYDYNTCSWNWGDGKVRERIAEIRGHPAIFAYFVDDEPHAFCPGVVQALRDRNALVKSLDPGALTFIAENRVEAFDDLANVVDVLGVVAYPCSHKYGCVYSKITDKVTAVEQAGWTHYWGMVQTAGDEYYRSPSPTELQAILDTWHATRQEGEVNFAWDCCGRLETLKDHPDLWDVWRRENALW